MEVFEMQRSFLIIFWILWKKEYPEALEILQKFIDPFDENIAFDELAGNYVQVEGESLYFNKFRSTLEITLSRSKGWITFLNII